MQVTLVVPWLARFDPSWFNDSESRCRTRALDRWLRFAQTGPSRVEGALSTAPLRFFGVDTPAAGDPPYAALSYLGDGGAAGTACWVRVDPVHMRPDMARLLLFAVPDFEIPESHAEALGGTVREALADWGEMDLRHPARWYLRLHERPAVATTPLHAVTGEDVQGALPSGEDGVGWRARINEIQMRLFDHPVNQERERAGLAPINGVWPWGVGVLAALRGSAFQTLASNSPVVRGLGLASGIDAVADLERPIDWSRPELASKSHLVWLEPPNPRVVGDPAAWGAWLRHLEYDWASALLEGVRRGAIERISLHAGDGTARSVTRRALRRFWRAAKPMHRQIATQMEQGR